MPGYNEGANASSICTQVLQRRVTEEGRGSSAASVHVRERGASGALCRMHMVRCRPTYILLEVPATL